SAPLGSGTLQNRQCAIDLGNSTALLSGHTLTLTLAVTFSPVFAGAHPIFMFAYSGTEGGSDWEVRGTWTVPGTPPVVTADYVTPNAGTDAAQTFVLAYGDTAGATDLQHMWVSFDDLAGSCLAYYDRETNTLNLLDDYGVTYLSAPLGSGTLENS